MPNQATARALESDIVSRLAKFFPEAAPVRIPIKLSRVNNDGNGNGRDSTTVHTNDSAFLQDTVIEFGKAHEILFMVAEPLEFVAHVLVESTDGSFYAEATVVAVQYHPKRAAVAVRLLNHVANWIVKS